MSLKDFIILLIAFPLFVAASVSPAYSKDATANPSLLEKVKKADADMEERRTSKKAKDLLREEQMDVADKCSASYETCLEGCVETEKEKDHDKCDNGCREVLSKCEKELPPELKTIK